MRLRGLRKFGRSLLLSPFLAPCISLCQTSATTLPVGTPLAVRIDQHLPMRPGQTIQAQLIYPVYLHSALILPEKTLLTGTVVALRSNNAKRTRSSFNLDFTPFHIPVVRFTQITLADGTTLNITTDTATDGAPIFHLAESPNRKGGFLYQQFDAAIQLVRDQIIFFTAPGKGDRLLQLLYHQLPYHPQRIEKDTAWTVETAQPLVIPKAALPIPPPALLTTAQSPPSDQPPTWLIQANLDKALSSATAKSGELIHATVAEPIFNGDHTIAVPQGATIVGTVTKAHHARIFGRSGTLRFAFRQLILPSGLSENVPVLLAGADTTGQQKLVLDSEGDVSPRPQDKIVVPLILLGLASAPLDRDPGDNDEWVKNGGASNSLGLAGFITGLAVNDRNVSAGFGYYGAALSIFDRWIKRGHEVTFARDTRLVLQTTPRNSSALKPNAR